MDLFEALELPHAVTPATKDAFELMAALNEAYGFDDNDPSIDGRCVEAKVLMFNDLHETPAPAFARRVNLLAHAFGVGVEDDDGPKNGQCRRHRTNFKCGVNPGSK